MTVVGCCVVFYTMSFCFFFFKQKTAYEMCGRDWSSDVCSSDLDGVGRRQGILQIGSLQYPLAAANAIILLTVTLVVVFSILRVVNIRKEL